MLLTSPRVPGPASFPLVPPSTTTNTTTTSSNSTTGAAANADHNGDDYFDGRQRHERRFAGESVHGEPLSLQIYGDGTQRRFVVSRSDNPVLSQSSASWSRQVTAAAQQLSLTEVLLVVLVVLLQLPSLSSSSSNSGSSAAAAAGPHAGGGVTSPSSSRFLEGVDVVAGSGGGRLSSALLKVATQQTAAAAVAVVGGSGGGGGGVDVSEPALTWSQWGLSLGQRSAQKAAQMARMAAVLFHRVPRAASSFVWGTAAAVLQYAEGPSELCAALPPSLWQPVSAMNATTLAAAAADGQLPSDAIFHCPCPSPALFWSVVMLSVVCLRLTLRLRSAQSDEVLVLGGIGLQTTVRDGLGRVLSRRFVETDAIRSVFIHEAFYRQTVIFYLGALVDDEKHVMLLLPTTVPRLALLQRVLCGIRGALYQEADEGLTMAELEKLRAD